MINWAFISIVIAFCFSPLLASEIPIGSQSCRELYTLARELYGRSLTDHFEYSIQDFHLSRTLSDSDLPQAQIFRNYSDFFLSSKDDFQIKSGVTAMTSAFYDNDKNGKIYPQLFPFIRADFNSRVSAVISYSIDTRLDENPRYRGEVWKGVAGLAENSTIQYNGGEFKARFGIERLSWGYGRNGNLMFSSSAMPLPLLGWSFRRGIFDFESINGFLNSYRYYPDPADSINYHNAGRYISAHSITLYPFRGFSISLREAVIYGGPGRRFELGYAVPLLWYHGFQLNNRLDDNTIVELASDYRYGGKFWVFGELLIDDYQIEKKTRTDYEPDEIGILIGAEIYDLFQKNSTMAFEFARVNNWTYNQLRSYNRHIHENFPLGYPLGNDFDKIEWKYSVWITNNFRCSYFGSLTRKGEGEIDSPWTAPWMNVDDYSESFPSGIIEKTIVNELAVTLFLKNNLWSKFKVGLSDINNVGHVSERNSQTLRLEIELGYQLSLLNREF